MAGRSSTSLLAVRGLQLGVIVLLLFGAGTWPADRGIADADVDAFVSRTMRAWCESHGSEEGLQAVLVDVRFHAEPPLFAEGEGVVAAPLALDLPGSQRVIEVAGQPSPLRTLTVQGVTTLTWEYAGRVHRDMRFAGLALVERPPLTRVVPPPDPTFEHLPPELRPESLARATDLEEHGLERCKAFPEWALHTAGPPPYTEQILRLVRAVSEPFDPERNEAEDLCAAIRQGRFTRHRAHVAVVMAARELGVPAFGFASATPRQIHLVGTYADQTGWILIDIERPDEGWFTGGPPLVTIVPLLGGFAASSHGSWFPQAGAYAQSSWGVSSFSGTEWRGRLAPGALPTDTTEAGTLPFDEKCR